MFKDNLKPDQLAQERAHLILTAMGDMGVGAMAVGARDLSAGVDFLKHYAEGAKVLLVSVNLVDARGARIFAASQLVNVGGLKVALIGASPNGPWEGARGLPPVAEVLKEAKKVRPKADVVIALAAISYADALQLAQESDGAVDFVFQSGESRGEGFAESMGKSFVIRSGDRGRQLGSLALTLAKKKGPFVDSGEKERTQQSLHFIETQIENTRGRMETAPNESVRKSLEQTLASFEKRRVALAQTAAQSSKADGRSFALSFIGLGDEVPDDPKLRDRVAQLEPTPSPAQ